MHAFDDPPYLRIVVISIACGPRTSCRRDSRPRRLVRQIFPDLRRQLFAARKEDRFLILAEALQMSIGPLGQQESAAAGNLEALMHELVLVRVRQKTQVDLRLPDRLRDTARRNNSPSAIECAADASRDRCPLPRPAICPRPSPARRTPSTAMSAYCAPVVIGCADERHLAVAVRIAPPRRRRKMNRRLIRGLDLDHVARAASLVVAQYSRPAAPRADRSAECPSCRAASPGPGAFQRDCRSCS